MSEQTLIQKISKEVAETIKEVREIKKLLSGNGDIGFCERVRNVEKDINEVKKEVEAVNERPRGWLRDLILVGQSVAALSIIIAAVMYIVKGLTG